MDVADLSIYAVGVANNGGGTDGMETETLPAISLLAGESHWLLRDPVAYAAYFGADSIFATGVVDVDYSVHSKISQNGDDAIELFRDGIVVDIYGDIDVDGTGTAWEYKDSFATRNADVSAPSVTFDQSQWTIAGYGPAGFVAGESGDECSDDSTTSCDSACGQYPSFPDCPATVCEKGTECGGQVSDECGSACPPECGVDSGICSTACVSGFFCPTGSSWDGASMSCVLTEECATSGR